MSGSRKIYASHPNEIWHIEITLIRLLDGTRAYLQAVIDNFSRCILTWKVSVTFNPSATAELLIDASKGLIDDKPTLLVAGGVENFNSAVGELIESGDETGGGPVPAAIVLMPSLRKERPRCQTSFPSVNHVEHFRQRIDKAFIQQVTLNGCS